MDEYRNLTDREILILLRQDFKNEVTSRNEKQATTEKRLDSHARDIKDLRAWRFYTGGAIAALGAYFGIKLHGG